MGPESGGRFLITAAQVLRGGVVVALALLLRFAERGEFELVVVLQVNLEIWDFAVEEVEIHDVVPKGTSGPRGVRVTRSSALGMPGYLKRSQEKSKGTILDKVTGNRFTKHHSLEGWIGQGVYNLARDHFKLTRHFRPSPWFAATPLLWQAWSLCSTRT